MQKRKKIPTKPRFALATQKAYDLLAALEVKEFPVDPKQIIKNFYNWNLAGWLELKYNTGEEDPLNLNAEKAEGKTVKMRDSDSYLIVYDERECNDQRIRWTLAHEIGHIVLGHLVEFESTSYNRRGLTEEEYGVLEVEAHWFAADLLAPKTIIRRFDFEDKSQGISLICDISKNAADKRLKEIKRRDLSYYKHESAIFRNFFNYLMEGRYYQTIHDTASKFYPSTLYTELCRESRICRKCGAFITDESYKFCPVCGAAVPEPERYMPNNLGNGIFTIGSLSSLYLKGKPYYELPVGSDGRLIFCPICKSVELLENKEVCLICNTPTTNKCLSEGKSIKHPYRFCPDCGAETTFKAIYDSFPVRITTSNIELSEDLDDYIECDYWSFIVMTIRLWEKKQQELFAVLEDSVAFYDCEEMIVFVRGEKEKEYAEECKEVILNCLSKYAESPVKNIEIRVAKPATY